MNRSCRITVAVLVLSAVSIDLAWGRKWTSRDGTSTVEAELLDVEDGIAILKKENGKTTRVPLAKLSLPDVDYVQKILRETRPDTPNETPPAPTKSPTNKPVATAPPKQPAAFKELPALPLTQPNQATWQVVADPSPVIVDVPSAKNLSIDWSESGVSKLIYPVTPSNVIGQFFEASDARVKVWDMNNGRKIGDVEIPEIGFHSVAINANGTMLAVGLTLSNKIRIHDFANPESSRELTSSEETPHYDFFEFAGTDRLVTSISQHGMDVWNVRSGEHITHFKLERVYNNKPLAVSPGGHYLAAFEGADRPFRLYDLRNGAVAGTLEFETKKGVKVATCYGLAFSQEGDELAGLFDTQGLYLRCWSLSDGKLIKEHHFKKKFHELFENSSMYSGPALEFIPKQRGWVVCGRGIIDREKGGPVWIEKTGQENYQEQRRVLDDSHFIYLDGKRNGKSLRVGEFRWDQIGRVTEIVSKGGTVEDARLPPLKATDMSQFQEVSLDSPSSWNYRPEPMPAIERAFSQVSLNLQISASTLPSIMLANLGAGKAIVTGTAKIDKVEDRVLQIQRIDLATGKVDCELETKYLAAAADFSQDGERVMLLTGKDKERVDLYHMPTRLHVVGFRPYQDSDAPQKEVAWANFAYDGHLVTQGRNGLFRLWDIATARAIYGMNLGTNTRICLTPSRKHVVALNNNLLRIIDLQTHAAVGELERPQTITDFAVWGISVSNDGRILAASLTNNDIHVLVAWDLEDGRIVTESPIPAGGIKIAWITPHQVLLERMPSMPRRSQSFLGPMREIDPRQFDLIDIKKQRVVWSYQIPFGSIAPFTIGDQLRFVYGKDILAKTQWVGVALPGPDTAQLIDRLTVPKPLLTQGDKVALNIQVKATDQTLLAREAETKIHKELVASLGQRGIQVSDRGEKTLNITLTEKETGEKIVYRVVGVGIRNVEVPITQLSCELSFDDATGTTTWSRQIAVENRADLRFERVPDDVTIPDYLRKKQWNSVTEWAGKSAVPSRLYSSDVYEPLGRSILTPNGEVRIQEERPQPQNLPPKKKKGGLLDT